MSKYLFYDGDLSDQSRLAFTRFLFNEEKHLQTQATGGWVTFSLLEEKSKLIQAQVHFHISNNIAESPVNAPFGSVEFADSLSAAKLFDFLKEAELKLIQRGVKKILVKDAPQIYRLHKASILCALLTDLNFKVIKQEVNSAIIVDDALWRAKIAEAEYRRLKRCENEKLVFKQIQNSELKKIYQFIAECREEREVRLSMTFKELENVVKKLPTSFLLFGVFKNDELIAAVVSIRVSETILYNFYPAHRKAFDQLSPMVFLLDNQYRFCQENGIQILDLGTSALHNKTNFSLLNFKSQVGGIASLKLTFEKDLNGL